MTALAPRLRLALVALGGLALVTSAFLPWSESRLGGGRAGFELANLALSLPYTPGPARAAALAWYLIPVLGGLALVVSAGGPRTARFAPAALGVIAALGAAAAVVAFGGLAAGPLFVAGGALALVARAAVPSEVLR